MKDFKKSDEELFDEDEVEAIMNNSDNSVDDNIMPPNSSSDEEQSDMETNNASDAAGGSTSGTYVNNDDDDESDDGDDDESDSDDDSDSEEDDPLVQAIKSAKERRKQHPPDIVFKNHVSDLSFHPGEDIIAVASVTGDVLVYQYSLEENILKETIEMHSKACRAIEYSNDGDYLVTCGKEKSIMVTDTSTSKLRQFYDNAHENPPYCLYILNENAFCSGDESGIMKIWDVRRKQEICSYKVGDEQISSIISNDTGRHIVCCSSDCVTCYDFANRKLFAQSEPYDSELTSMGVFKQGTKLVVGTIKGMLYVFNWGQFGYHTDVYHGPKNDITSILAVTENIMVTGCGDGSIRAANLFPHKQLGVVGQHKVSAEEIDISHDGEYIASAGFDEVVKFWDIRYFEDIKVKPEKTKKTDAKNNLPSSSVRNPGDFFADLS